MTELLILMVGGAIGFLTAALCRAAGRSEELSERMESRYIPGMMMETSEEIAPEKRKIKNN